MIAKGILIGEVIKTGWRYMKNNIGFFVVLIILSWLVFLIPIVLRHMLGISDTMMEEGHVYNSPAIALVTFIHILLGWLVGIGWVRISLDIIQDKKGRFRDLFTGWSVLIQYAVAQFLYSLMVGIGLILLVVPGIYLAIRYSLWSFYVVDKNVGPIEALTLSSEATNGARWDLLGLGLLSLLINLLGVLCLGVGLFATIPTTALAWALTYRALQRQSETPVV